MHPNCALQFAALAFAAVVAAGAAHAASREPPLPGATAIRVTVTTADGSTVTFIAREYEVTGLSKGGTGAHDYAPFIVGRGMDIATSPRIARWFAEGEKFPVVLIELVDFTGALIFSYMLEDAWVAVYRHITTATGVIEDVGFGFKEIVFTGTDAVRDEAHIFLDRERAGP
jgi:hypothetical protein